MWYICSKFSVFLSAFLRFLCFQFSSFHLFSRSLIKTSFVLYILHSQFCTAHIFTVHFQSLPIASAQHFLTFLFPLLISIAIFASFKKLWCHLTLLNLQYFLFLSYYKRPQSHIKIFLDSFPTMEDYVSAKTRMTCIFYHGLSRSPQKICVHAIVNSFIYILNLWPWCSPWYRLKAQVNFWSMFARSDTNFIEPARYLVSMPFSRASDAVNYYIVLT